ncbi:MAG: RNA methyltransferase [Thermodesulfobacteriota bacterium]
MAMETERLPTVTEKRIKRHVLGKEHGFFAVCAPGLATVCDSELAAIDALRGVDRRISDEGVAFHGRLVDCFAANLWCRTATRVLMRLYSFSSFTFSHFFTQCKHFPWELFLAPDIPVDVQAATHHCRLHHTEAIAHRVLEGISERVAGLKHAEDHPNDPMEQRIFVRGVDDRFTLSIDSSGLPLYKRGIKTIVGRAPLRETLAAGLLRLAEYDGSAFLLDPMCGSGTFSLEAVSMARNVPPGWVRAFAFERWPGFRAAQWAYLRKQALSRIDFERPISILAADKRIEACERLEAVCRKHEFLKDVPVACMDVFDIQPRALSSRPGIVVLNPPYGIRIGTQTSIPSLYRDLVRKLSLDFKGWRLVWISPVLPALKLAESREYRFSHGGLSLKAVIGRIG